MTEPRDGWLWQSPKLTPAQRDEIRRRYLDGETATALATEFGVTAQHIRVLVPRREQP